MAIYKTRNTGTGNGMGGIQGTRRMFTRISRNLLEDSGEFSGFSIPGNAREDSGELSERFSGVFGKNSWKCFQLQINQSRVLLKKKQMLLKVIFCTKRSGSGMSR